MKRSSLKTEIGTYRTTPDSWGDTCVMVDEDAVVQAMADAAGGDINDYNPNGGDNDTPGEVTIWADAQGDCYAILTPFCTRERVWHNRDMYMSCQNPNDATDGGALLYGLKWERFDPEDN